jgi:hypothetical protein
METGMVSEALKGLIAAGPVATILGIFCYTLWNALQEERAENKRQQNKMLKLAVRVQRAVEVLADIEDSSTEVEDVLEDDAKKHRKPDADDTDEV